MPEIRLKSQQKEVYPQSGEPPQQRDPEKPATGKTRPPPVRFDDSGAALRRQALAQLASIQLNTAGRSGPYRSDEETMEKVTGNHSAVRELRVVLSRSLLLPRRGPLARALLSWMLEACGGKYARAARSLGITVRQLRRLLERQPSPLLRGQPRLSRVE